MNVEQNEMKKENQACTRALGEDGLPKGHCTDQVEGRHVREGE
jgi:hypothetical protein